MGESTDGRKPIDPNEIARALAALDEIEPLEMTEEERAEIEAAREAHKAWEKARFYEHAERLRRMWDGDDSPLGGPS